MKDVPVDETLFSWPDEPRLIGSICAACATTTFPAQQSCPRCTRTDVRAAPLATTGQLWTWTVQAFEPKPPYLGDGPFEPYGVGYVELAGEVRVEARLTEADPGRLRIGMPMELTLVPVPGGRTRGVVTYAFRPVTQEPDHGGAR